MKRGSALEEWGVGGGWQMAEEMENENREDAVKAVEA
jgi:hypothetical protein